MVTTHWIDATLVFISCRMTGSTTPTMLPSSADMNVPTPTATSRSREPTGGCPEGSFVT